MTDLLGAMETCRSLHCCEDWLVGKICVCFFNTGYNIKAELQELSKYQLHIIFCMFKKEMTYRSLPSDINDVKHMSHN